MSARRPNFATAAIELGLIIAAVGLGFLLGDWRALAALIACAACYWAITRAGVLMSMNFSQRLLQGGAGIAMLALVLGGAFVIGLAIRGDAHS